MTSDNKNKKRTLAVIAIIGALGATLSNWTNFLNFFKHDNENKNIINQISNDQSSPNISNVAGDVNLNYNNQKAAIRFPDFNKEIRNGSEVDEFEHFISTNKGKIVHINTHIDSELAELYESDAGKSCSFSIFSEASNERNENHSAGYQAYDLFIKNTPDCVAQWYSGGYRLSGFFTIDENIEMHQGIIYGATALRQEKILLENQNSR
jgi:hypothetical protein